MQLISTDRPLRVAGLDPSLRNWGIALGDIQGDALHVNNVQVVNPVLPTGKMVRQNSLDLASAFQLYEQTVLAIKYADVVFVEVPVGSQSARAMASYGICVGVLGAVRASGSAFFEVTPTEVKMATVGKKTASKNEMIHWATDQHPEAPWPTYQRNGEKLLSDAKAEHMADAIAAIYAGCRLETFKQLLRLRQQSQADRRLPLAA